MQILVQRKGLTTLTLSTVSKGLQATSKLCLELFVQDHVRFLGLLRAQKF